MTKGVNVYAYELLNVELMDTFTHQFATAHLSLCLRAFVVNIFLFFFAKRLLLGGVELAEVVFSDEDVINVDTGRHGAALENVNHRWQ
jgi:hypothetical protein